MCAETLKEWLPYCCRLFALGDAVGGDQRGADVCALHHLRGFEVPCGNVVYFSGVAVGFALFVGVNGEHFRFLFFGLQRIAHKWRIAEDVGELVFWGDGVPVDFQRVAVDDVGAFSEGQAGVVLPEFFGGFEVHEVVHEPHADAGDLAGKVFYFNAGELGDADFELAMNIEHALAGKEHFQNFQFQHAQFAVGDD